MFTVSPREADVNIVVSDITYGEAATVLVNAEVDGVYAVFFNNIDGVFDVTVRNGVGSISVSGLNVESYSATVSIDDDNYKAVNSTTFTVSKASTAITAADVAKVYNVAKNYIIYLKDASGKAVNKATVTVKIGSTTYTKTTNADGQVSIAIENLKPATYTTTINFAGNTNYIASSLTTGKITVSKATPKMTASKATFKLSDKTKNML